jgi:hypothetical protein
MMNKALCCFKSSRNRRNSGSLLPVTVKSRQDAVERPLLSNYSVSQDSWSSAQQQQWQQPPQIPQQTMFNPITPEQQFQPPEEDFFKDMTPQVKQQKKVVILSRGVGGTGSTLGNNKLVSDKFRVDDSLVPTTLSNDLGDLRDTDCAQEEGVWEDDLLDIDSTLKQVKEEERRRRQHHHQQQNLHQQQKSKKSLAATRLSSS